MQLLLSILMDGLSYGMVLFMISVGLSITMGLMRVVNLAHGVFALLGGCLVTFGAARFGLRPELAVGLAIGAVSLLAWPLERGLFRHVYGRGELQQVLLTIGMVFVGMAAVGTIFGNGLMSVPVPDYIKGSIDLGFRVLPRHRLVVLVAGVATLFALWFLMSRTRFGVEMRATVDNSDAAEALGIDTEKIYRYGFMLGAALAASGGILGAEIMPLEPYYPLKYLVIFLAVVAVGGMGSITGSFMAALVLGLVETSAKYLMPEIASVMFYSTMLAVLSWRPEGLFGRAG